MPAITIGGLASGLPPNLVDQLVEAEKLPIKNLENRKGKKQAKLDLVNELDTKVRSLQEKIGTLATKNGFNDIKLESGDPNIIQGTVDPSLNPKGSWNVEVMELANKAAAVTNGFPDKDKSEVGVGYFRFYTPNGETEVYIDGANSTLDNVAQQINAANAGVKAAVINDRSDPDYPYRLMISGNNVGGDNMIEYPTLYFLDGDQDIYVDKENEARNGRVKVDGFEFEIADNTIEDIIPGVTLELKQANPGKTVNVTVSENREAVSTKIGEFITSMNDLLGFMQTQSRVDENTDTTRTLGGDSLIRNIERRFRSLIQNPQFGVGKFQRLIELGIEFNREGTLKFNEDKFNATLQSDPDSVRQFFAGDGFNTGFIPSLRREITTVTNQSFGQIAQRKKSLQNNIKRIDQSISNKERQLQRREVQLRNKFAKLEETMSRLKSQGGQMQAAMANVGPNLSGASLQG